MPEAERGGEVSGLNVLERGHAELVTPRAHAPALRAPLALPPASAAGRVEVPHCDRAVLATAEEALLLSRDACGGARGRRGHARHE